MSDTNPTDDSQLEIRPNTRRVLESITIVRHGHEATDTDRLNDLHDIVEAARLKLIPAPKAPSPGRGRKPKDS